MSIRNQLELDIFEPHLEWIASDACPWEIGFRRREWRRIKKDIADFLANPNQQFDFMKPKEKKVETPVPQKETRSPFGPHVGQPLRLIPVDGLSWLLERTNLPNLRESLRAEMRRRQEIEAL